jgi:hypothetical protein
MTDVTTTHACDGEGHPALRLATGEEDWSGQAQPVFALDHEVTTIGSSPDADIRLDGLEPVRAQVQRDERDEYVLVLLAPGRAPAATGDDPSATPGAPATGLAVERVR